MDRITKRVWDALDDEQRWALFQRIDLQRSNAELTVSMALQQRGQATRRALAALDFHPRTQEVA